MVDDNFNKQVESNVIEVYKPIGYNSADIVRQQQELLNIDKICYAGRLDPMAHGMMKILINQEVKNMEHYLQMDKTYRFKVLIGVSTDTTDVLGLLTKYHPSRFNINRIITSFLITVGTFQQKFHKFSSKPCKSKYDGKAMPLWYYAKNNKLDDVDIPTKSVTIYDIVFNQYAQHHSNELLTEVLDKLNTLLINGKTGYRTSDIIKQWSSFKVDYTFDMLTFTIKVSTGTYIRQLVQDVSDALRIPMLAYDIERLSFN